MTNALRRVLNQYREASQSEREKGSYFERLAVAFIKNDPGMAQQYEDAWLFSEWALANGLSASDTGIDAVAQIRDGGGFCAIQCKFYAEDYRIQKSDIDSFFTASGKKPFTRRLIIDTTVADWSKNAREALNNQWIDTTRIGLDRLEQSLIDWSAYLYDQKIIVGDKKTPRDHQVKAVDSVEKGFAVADRGKMIMACGTGKTYTALKISEQIAGAGKRVLFLVPSLALMSQTIREWTIDSETPIRAFAVCSDAQVGKRSKFGTDDIAEIETHDLDYPATTNAEKLAEQASKPSPDRMTVVFSTYQSIRAISDAQKLHGFPNFDLIICDEAHRTVGATGADDEDSNFVKVHDQEFLAGNKRLYMTATPRIFSDDVKAKASKNDAVLFSMDDEELFGEVFFQRGFGWAVEKGLLTDYKVIVLAVDEAIVSSGVQSRLADSDSEVKLDDATKIIGCYKALTKVGMQEDVAADPGPMRRALAFCQTIKQSEIIQDEFSAVVSEYLASGEAGAKELAETGLNCEIEHVDGTFNAKSRTRLLDWLKEEHGDNSCRILTNARCLSEGVDVPALDGIMFLHPRKSQIDVVQSVGRVMRRAEGKKMGYVILPVASPAGVSAETALAQNERYKVVWQILNALRSHDERLDAQINKMDLGEDISSKIEIIAVSNTLPVKKEKASGKAGIGQGNIGADDGEEKQDTDDDSGKGQTAFSFDEFSEAIMAKIVKKCGRRDYWEDWAVDIAKIAQTHITRITAIVEKEGTKEREAFDAFLAEIRDDLNESISHGEAIEMLAQHIITKPVFEALFEGYSFTKNNPVSVAIQKVLDVLNEQNLEKESESLHKFYESVERRAHGIENADAKQKIIVELYDKFFRKAFPQMTEKLGIVYTPVEVVDFIIHSVNEVLQSEFGQTLGSKGVHILDPFTGTGTFITRMIQSGLIKPEELEYKYKNEIHANEIVLLAYYIAAINIEAVYHTESGGDYVPFEGICLTDTFQLYEQEKDMLSELMADNSNRRTKQKALDIRVIVGNPPYSVGQSSANDNAANVSYPNLDGRIRETYAARSKMSSIKNLYDSYIRAIRWGSDRLGDSGVIAFVSGSGWLERQFADGMRKCLAEEFSSLHIFHLRGDIRKNMLSKGRAGEGGNVFGSGSMTGIAISLMVKNPEKIEKGKIYFHDIGDNKSQLEKLSIIRDFGSFDGIARTQNGCEQIEPDQHHDWINQRDISFDYFIKMGDKKSKAKKQIFENYSLGINTNRDAWCYNSSKAKLAENMESMIEVYNSEVTRIGSIPSGVQPADAIQNDKSKISWSSSLISSLTRQKAGKYDGSYLVESHYRPFQRQWLYYDKMFNHRTGQMPYIFPDGKSPNKIIHVTGVGARAGFSALMSDNITDLHTLDSGQCFPLYLYGGSGELNLYSPEDDEKNFVDGITDFGLKHFQSAYPGQTISKEDIFYYTYGILHSEDYRKTFADNLSKELPRIPLVKTTDDFWAFVKAGRELGDLHVNYETVEPYPVEYEHGKMFIDDLNAEDYRVIKMKFGGRRPNLDKSTVIYNNKITMTGIPLAAYDYIVNGKSALDWVMERQVVKTDKASGIANDANLYAIETMKDPAYPLKLFQRVITVSLRTMEIVRSLPKLDIKEVEESQ